MSVDQATVRRIAHLARIAVTDTRATLSVSLPLLAAPFSGPIETYLRKEAAKMLADPA